MCSCQDFSQFHCVCGSFFILLVSKNLKVILIESEIMCSLCNSFSLKEFEGKQIKSEIRFHNNIMISQYSIHH